MFQTGFGRLGRVWAFSILAFVFTTAGLEAQTPTPEGTTIESIATATYTDANANTYAPVADTLAFTVGHMAGLQVDGTATVTPDAPSSGNTVDFTVENTGNGADSVVVGASTDPGLTITQYEVDAQTFASLSALNDYLAGQSLASGGSMVITVTYDVDASLAGGSGEMTLDATSRRDAGTSDDFTTTVEPPFNYDVTVTDVTGDQNRLPSNNAPAYSHTFNVTNNSGTQATFDLEAALGTAGVVTIVSVNGDAGAQSSITLNDAQTEGVEVLYTVEDVARGSSAVLTLTATHDTEASVSDSDNATITVSGPELDVLKEAFRDDQTTPITTSDEVAVDEYFWYRVTVTNNGDEDAEDVEVVDDLSEHLNHDSHQGDSAGWDFSVTGQQVTATLTVDLPATESRHFWIRVQVQ